MPKFIKLTPEQKTELGTQITDSWESDNIDRQEWLQSLKKWALVYQGRPVEKNLPWVGASNLMVPVTQTVISVVHPRLMSSLMHPTPIVGFRPQEETDAPNIERREKFLDWALREEINIFPVLDRTILGMLVNGVQIVKTSWSLQTRHLRDKHEFPPDIDPQTAITAVLEGDSEYLEAVERVSDEKIEATIKGRKVEYDVKQTPKALCIYTEREEIVYDAPKVIPINPEDFSTNSDVSFDLQTADHINHRYYLTKDALLKEIKRGVFVATDEEKDELELLTSASIQQEEANTYNIKQARETITGQKVLERIGDPETIELIDSYRPYDVNDDGFDEEIIVTVPVKKPSIILRAVRLEEIYRHGLRPFTMFYFDPVADSIWALGIPQILEGLQDEFNTMHNQRVDFGEVSNIPWGWYKAGAGKSHEKMPLEPGYLFPVDDINDVKMHTPSNHTSYFFEEESLLWSLVEKRMKVSDLTFGRVGSSQGVARTASGVQALQSNSAAGFDIYIRRTQEAFKGLVQQILALYQQYMPPNKEIRIIGGPDEPPILVTRRDILGNKDMIFTGNSLSTDRDVERQSLTFLAQSTMNPQSLGFLMQIGVLTPPSVAYWYRHLFHTFDVPHLERMIVIPDVKKIPTPDEIIDLIFSGSTPIPKPGEDHPGIIEKITQLLTSSKAVGLSPEQKVGFQNQIALRKIEAQREMMIQQMIMLQMQQQAQQQAMMQPFDQGTMNMSLSGFGGAPQPPKPQGMGLPMGG